MEKKVTPPLASPAASPTKTAEGIILETEHVDDGNGRTGIIGREQVAEAEQILKEYKAGKATLENRIISNEKWYKLRQWQEMAKTSTSQIEPASAWLFNSLANKHADAMDNYPEPNVLPREESDEAAAKALSEVLPVVIEQTGFEQVYSDVWWYKLKTGTGAYGVFWDNTMGNGLGDIAIRKLDLLNLFWEPGITDIQASRNLFHVELMDRDLFTSRYPFMKGKEPSAYGINRADYAYDDAVKTDDKVLVVDWYYKVEHDGRQLVHYCKFAGGEVLYASENDSDYASRGYYDHGRYPVEFDVLFPNEGSPAGFGYLDVCKSPQEYIDRLDQAILRNAIMSAEPRWFVRGDGMIDEAEFADWNNRFIHYKGSGDPRESLVEMKVPQFPSAAINMREAKVEELKETSGNRDFSQGGTSSGVTAASAIAALQEAGNKLTRDMVKASYRSFRRVCELCIELMRQFYTEERYFRITGSDGKTGFVPFSNAAIRPQQQGAAFGLDIGERLPVFDIVVTAQRQSPFSTAVENERAKELYGMGFFRPDLADQALSALDMMQFEGVEKVREKISQGQTLYKQNLELQQTVIKLTALVDSLRGTNMAPEAAQQMMGQAQVSAPGAAGKKGVDALRASQDSAGTGARVAAARGQAQSTGGR